MGHGQSSEMKNFRIPDDFFRHFFLRQHHVSPGVPVEGKIPVPIRKGMHHRQGCMHLIIHTQIIRTNPYILNDIFQPASKGILSNFSNKGYFMPQSGKHCQHIAGRPARVRLKNRIALAALIILDKINQQFP